MINAEQARNRAILEALEALDSAVTQIYNIEGARWQMAYDTLEAVLANLNIERPKVDMV